MKGKQQGMKVRGKDINPVARTDGRKNIKVTRKD